MPLLPNHELAVVDIGKIRDYIHGPTHARGRHKARVFRDKLGLTANDAPWLRTALLDGLRASPAIADVADRFGARWRVDMVLTR